MDWLFPDFSPDQLAEAIRLTRIVLPAQIFFVVGALFAAVQYAKGRFVIPTLAPIAYNLGIILGGVSYPLMTGDPGVPGGVHLGSGGRGVRRQLRPAVVGSPAAWGCTAGRGRRGATPPYSSTSSSPCH